MQNIRFQDNELEEFMINDDPARVIRFNPADAGILERLGIAKRLISAKMAELDAMKVELPAAVGRDAVEDEDTREAASAELEAVFDMASGIMIDINEFVRQQVNFIFDGDVAAAVFGNQSPLSTIRGVPLFERFLNAVTPVLEKAMQKERAASKKRIQRYTKRYHG